MVKILIRHDSLIYRFLDIQRNKDGSVYLSVDRTPPSSGEHYQKTYCDSDFTPVLPAAGPRKLSYHTTGRVNYHGLISDLTSFFEPLVDITQENPVLAISVPSVLSLDLFTDELDTEIVCMIQVDHMGRFDLGVTLAPPMFRSENFQGVALNWDNFALLLHPVALDLVPPNPKHFMYVAPPSKFGNQRISRNQAELAYVQGKNETEIVIRGPNNLGHYTMYFGVEMRVAPKVTVEMADSSYRFELLSNDKPHKLTFRIHGKGDLIRDPDLRPFIRSILLSAEL